MKANAMPRQYELVFRVRFLVQSRLEWCTCAIMTLEQIDTRDSVQTIGVHYSSAHKLHT